MVPDRFGNQVTDTGIREPVFCIYKIGIIQALDRFIQICLGLLQGLLGGIHFSLGCGNLLIRAEIP